MSSRRTARSCSRPSELRLRTSPDWLKALIAAPQLSTMPAVRSPQLNKRQSKSRLPPLELFRRRSAAWVGLRMRGSGISRGQTPILANADAATLTLTGEHDGYSQHSN